MDVINLISKDQSYADAPINMPPGHKYQDGHQFFANGPRMHEWFQEMNREVNTMGSKADGLRVSELVIAAKAELEKMREQVQNVE